MGEFRPDGGVALLILRLEAGFELHFECVAGHRWGWVSRRAEGVSADFVEVGLADALAVALKFDVLAEQLADIFPTADGGDDEVRHGAVGGF